MACTSRTSTRFALRGMPRSSLSKFFSASSLVPVRLRPWLSLAKALVGLLLLWMVLLSPMAYAVINDTSPKSRSAGWWCNSCFSRGSDQDEGTDAINHPSANGKVAQQIPEMGIMMDPPQDPLMVVGSGKVAQQQIPEMGMAVPPQDPLMIGTASALSPNWSDKVTQQQIHETGMIVPLSQDPMIANASALSSNRSGSSLVPGALSGSGNLGKESTAKVHVDTNYDDVYNDQVEEVCSASMAEELPIDVHVVDGTVYHLGRFTIAGSSREMAVTSLRDGSSNSKSSFRQFLEKGVWFDLNEHAHGSLPPTLDELRRQGQSASGEFKKQKHLRCIIEIWDEHKPEKKTFQEFYEPRPTDDYEPLSDTTFTEICNQVRSGVPVYISCYAGGGRTGQGVAVGLLCAMRETYQEGQKRIIDICSDNCKEKVLYKEGANPNGVEVSGAVAAVLKFLGGVEENRQASAVQGFYEALCDDGHDPKP